MAPPRLDRAVRVRKLARNTGQPVLTEDEIDSVEYRALLSQYNIGTGTANGVESGEAEEYHLQAALRSATNASAKEAEEIPAPPTAEAANIDYDSLYPLVFVRPFTYIRFSETVEECTACQYDMNTEDDLFLKAYNRSKSSAKQCSEDVFEQIMEFFEARQKASAPAGWLDGTVLSYVHMKGDIDRAVSRKSLDSRIGVFAQDIYAHWKTRREASGNQPLQPLAKEETDQKKDESDPYVCFRYRDAREKRKTRATARESPNAKKISDLRKELEDGKKLVELSLEREILKLKSLRMDKEIFELRADIKEQKIKLGIKTDDEDLINQRPQKRKISDFNQVQRQSGQPMRMPGRPDGRPLEADLVLLSDLQERKENAMRAELEDKAQAHRKWNIHHIDLTREPLSPVEGQGFETGFRPAMAQYENLTPPTSERSGSANDSDRLFPAQEKPEVVRLRYATPPEEDEPRRQQSYRRRIGRNGRQWIDRRGMAPTAQGMDPVVSDRWKYDSDDDNEQPVYEVDPYSTNALKFRASIPIPGNLLQNGARRDEKSIPQARANGSSPTNRTAIAAAPQAQSQPPSQPQPQART
ncbi:hypothetical protein LZ554_006526 [Drepanopeziza brunnea f. sp. 'monogermtubi']|nr:hypothetical protein LZ554_006526 [Drepanopeziza brunnea f. sp. 'monogermtubi']